MTSKPYTSFRLSSHGLTDYREMLRKSIDYSCDVESSSERFAFEATCFVLPELGVAHITSNDVTVKHAGGLQPDEGRDLIFAVMHEGTAQAQNRDREVVVGNGGAFLASQLEPQLMRRTGARLTNYSLRRSDLAPGTDNAIANLDRTLMTAIPGRSEAMVLLGGYTRMTFAEGVTLSPEAARLAVRHIHDLIALAIGATRDATEIAGKRGLRAARRAELYSRACRLIALSLDDPALSPGALAHRLGVSTRLLQKVFAERGETVTARLWSERVARAARLLSAPEAADRSVTDIAFACGFSDSSHFGRVFASRMGRPPSQWRARDPDTAQSR